MKGSFRPRSKFFGCPMGLIWLLTIKVANVAAMEK